jgi:hydrophobic/amphiphilic exporter-1 (mainly G- bacteria), HAE1 family
VLIFLLNFRSTFISALVLPTSIMATFMMLAFMGFTLNFMTLMALTLAIGLLIDDAIVVQENIMRHVQEGKPASFAAEFATKEIGLAVLATTALGGGRVPADGADQGHDRAVLLPLRTDRQLRGAHLDVRQLHARPDALQPHAPRKQTHQNPVFRALEKAFRALERVYETLLTVCLRHRGWWWWGWPWSSSSVSMSLNRFIRASFSRRKTARNSRSLVRAPLGASVERTRQIMESAAAPREGAARDDLRRLHHRRRVAAEQRGSMYVRLRENKPQRRQQGRTRAAHGPSCPTNSLAATGRRPHLACRRSNTLAARTGIKTAEVQYELLGSDLAVLEHLASRRWPAMLAVRRLSRPGHQPRERPARIQHPSQPRARRTSDVSPIDVADTVRCGHRRGRRRQVPLRHRPLRHRPAPSLNPRPQRHAQSMLDLSGALRNGPPSSCATSPRSLPTSVPVEISRYNRQRQITLLANLEARPTLGEAVNEINASSIERQVAHATCPPATTPRGRAWPR